MTKRMRMTGEYHVGALLRALVNGQYRDVVIDHITSNGRLAQCHWLEKGNKRFVTVSLSMGERDGLSGSRRAT
jgi:hypothetical protein